MSAREKSDLPEVAEKRANKAVSAAAELVERRGGAKENAELQSTVRTQSREAVSQAQARIREAVNRNRQMDILLGPQLETVGPFLVQPSILATQVWSDLRPRETGIAAQ